MVTINPSTVTVVEAGQSTTGGGCTPNPGYVCFNGKQYPFTYSRGVPSGYVQIAIPASFCVLYNGGNVANFLACGCGNTQCYGATSVNLLYTDNVGHYWFMASGNGYQFSAGFSAV